MAEVYSRQSMLDAVIDKMRAENKKQVIHSITIVSRLSVGIADKRDIGAHYDRVFKSCQQRYNGEGPTGILLIYPKHVVHVVEAPWEVLITVIKDLREMDRERSLLVSSRLLVFSSNVAHRLYPQWAFRVLSLPTLPQGELYQTNDSIEQTVASSLECLYKLGAHLSKLQQHQLKITMDSLTTTVPQYLLQQDMLEYFISCSDLNTPDEFLQRYCRPTDLVLDREIVWPLPVRLFPYDD